MEIELKKVDRIFVKTYRLKKKYSRLINIITTPS